VRIARDSSFVLRWVSLLFLAAALVLAVIELVSYSRTRNSYPANLTIAGVPVGGVSPEIAAQRILQVYTTPVEIQYAGAIIHLDPTVVGFQLNTESMLAAADLQRTGSSFWTGFWDYLWNRDQQTQDVPLKAEFSQERLRAYLKEEISSRYDQPAIPSQPVAGQTSFTEGTAGQELDVDRAVLLIEDALRSPKNRTVSLTFQRTTPGRPPLDSLKALIRQIIDLTPFDGVVGIYMLDLQTGQELHFAVDENREIPVSPDIAFTASSTIKIPVLVSVYNNLGPTLDEGTARLVLEMITKSENPATDALMERISQGTGPLTVTQDMKALGLENTFIAGYFYDGAPLLQRFETPANQRQDVFTAPDAYNQSTSADVGSLLADLYQCSQTGGGALVAAFGDKVNQIVCQEIIDYLKRDKIGALIEAGVPEGTVVAHKHGWISGPSGIIQNISDVGIVYSTGGNYVLVIYAYHPVQAVWDDVNRMVALISEAVYNYFNLTIR
jgi:beta-lactamase class A